MLSLDHSILCGSPMDAMSPLQRRPAPSGQMASQPQPPCLGTWKSDAQFVSLLPYRPPLHCSSPHPSHIPCFLLADLRSSSLSCIWLAPIRNIQGAPCSVSACVIPTKLRTTLLLVSVRVLALSCRRRIQIQKTNLRSLTSLSRLSH